MACLEKLAFIQKGYFEYSIFYLKYLFFLNYDESVSYPICSFNNTGTQDPVVYVIQTPEVVVLEQLLNIEVV